MSSPECGLCNQTHAPHVACAQENLGDPTFELVSWGITTTPLLRSVGLAINREIKLFVCLQCENAQTADSVLGHILSHNAGRLQPNVKQEILDITTGANIVSAYPTWASELSTEPRPQITGIRLKTGLSGCTDCGYTANLKKVQDHLKKPGHPLSGKPPLTDLMAQVLNSGTTRVNIRVVPRPEEEVSDVPVLDFIARFKSFEWRDHRPAEIPNTRMISPWLMRTRWHEHILPYRPHSAELREFVAIPTSHDPLAALHESVTQYFSWATALIDGTDELVLQKLNSKNPDKDGINNTPLHAHHQKDTLRGYALVISHFLAGLLRTSLHYKFPTLMELEHALTVFLAVGLEVDKQPALHSGLMALWKTQWPASPECHFPDPTMCFLTLFSFKESGTFADPTETTGPIARLCRGIQLVMLKEIHRLVDSGECPTQMAAFDLVRPFIVEKEMSTFNSLMSLQHYASALAFQTMSYPNIWWVDRENWTELLYKGNHITLVQLGQIFTELEVKIIDFGVLAENLGNTDTGYSFLHDVSNPFHTLKYAFADALLARPDIMAKFVTVDSAGNERPNMVFCRQWLMGLAELEGLVMLDTDMISGGPARGTELAAMLAKNGELRGRNLRALGRFLSIVKKSSGCFICAATVIRFVDDEYSHPIDRLAAVVALDPKSTAPLDDLYTQILSVVPHELQ
ncbi:hypothetical protein C8R44DRAFT_883572 [Mycena epipterygia]|nr:hypothetical protein C8R44DRAFT_883572 [Mycena epipterygia]